MLVPNFDPHPVAAELRYVALEIHAAVYPYDKEKAASFLEKLHALADSLDEHNKM
jgi:hypothetical protein